MRIRNLILVACILAGFSGFAQKQRTLYYTSQWELTVKDSAQYYRVCEIDTVNSLFIGEVNDYTLDGKLIMQGSYKADKKEVLGSIKRISVKSGVFTSYFPSGQIESQGEYSNNQRTGAWKYFYADGKPRYEIMFQDNFNFFVQASFDGTGNQLIKEGTGNWQYAYNLYNEKNKVIIRGSFVEGKKDGEWTCFYLSGEPVYLEKFNNDNFKSGKYAGAEDFEETIFREKFSNKFPAHFKYETTENFLYKKFLTKKNYPFLSFLKRDPSKPLTIEEEKDEANKVFLVVESPPEYIGGNDELHKFIKKNLKYNGSIHGSVFIGFIIDPDGSVVEASVIKGVCAQCDKAALDVIRKMPKWKPGMQSGKYVRVKFVLPIRL